MGMARAGRAAVVDGVWVWGLLMFLDPGGSQDEAHSGSDCDSSHSGTGAGDAGSTAVAATLATAEGAAKATLGATAVVCSRRSRIHPQQR